MTYDLFSNTNFVTDDIFIYLVLSDQDLSTNNLMDDLERINN